MKLVDDFDWYFFGSLHGGAWGRPSTFQEALDEVLEMVKIIEPENCILSIQNFWRGFYGEPENESPTDH